MIFVAKKQITGTETIKETIASAMPFTVFVADLSYSSHMNPIPHGIKAINAIIKQLITNAGLSKKQPKNVVIISFAIVCTSLELKKTLTNC